MAREGASYFEQAWSKKYTDGSTFKDRGSSNGEFFWLAKAIFDEYENETNFKYTGYCTISDNDFSDYNIDPANVRDSDMELLIQRFDSAFWTVDHNTTAGKNAGTTSGWCNVDSCAWVIFSPVFRSGFHEVRADDNTKMSNNTIFSEKVREVWLRMCGYPFGDKQPWMIQDSGWGTGEGVYDFSTPKPLIYFFLWRATRPESQDWQATNAANAIIAQAAKIAELGLDVGTSDYNFIEKEMNQKQFLLDVEDMGTALMDWTGFWMGHTYEVNRSFFGFGYDNPFTKRWRMWQHYPDGAGPAGFIGAGIEIEGCYNLAIQGGAAGYTGWQASYGYAKDNSPGNPPGTYNGTNAFDNYYCPKHGLSNLEDGVINDGYVYNGDPDWNGQWMYWSESELFKTMSQKPEKLKSRKFWLGGSRHKDMKNLTDRGSKIVKEFDQWILQTFTDEWKELSEREGCEFFTTTTGRLFYETTEWVMAQEILRSSVDLDSDASDAGVGQVASCNFMRHQAGFQGVGIAAASGYNKELLEWHFNLNGSTDWGIYDQEMTFKKNAVKNSEFQHADFLKDVNFYWKSFVEYAKKYISPENGVGDVLGVKMTQRELYNEAVVYAAHHATISWLQQLKDQYFMKYWKGLYDQMALLSTGGIEITDEMAKTLGNQAYSSYTAQISKRLEGQSETIEAEKDKLSKEEIDAREIYLKQCALLLNMQPLRKGLRTQMAVDLANSNPNFTSPLGINTGAKTSPAVLHHAFGQSGAPDIELWEGRIHLLDVNQSDERSKIHTQIFSPKGDLIKSFFNAKPHIIAALVPKVRLFKVFTNKEGNHVEIEFSFPKRADNTDVRYSGASYALETGRPMDTIGLKSFNITFEGGTPATARKDIKADLTIFTRDFKNLLYVRENKKSVEDINPFQEDFTDVNSQYKFIELLLYPFHDGKKVGFSNLKQHPFQYDSSHYRIRADVGWAVRSDKAMESLLETEPYDLETLKTALNFCNNSYYLNMVDHDLDFANDGSVKIKIEYRAYMESATKAPALDALASPSLNNKRKILKDELRELINDEACNTDQLDELLQTYSALEQEYIQQSYQSIITRLLVRRRIYYCFMKKADRDEFAKNGYFRQVPVLSSQKTSGTGTVDLVDYADDDFKADTFEFIDGEYRAFSNGQDPEIDGERDVEIINYFFLGDLLHTVMDCMFEKPPKGATGLAMTGKIRPEVKNTKFLLSSFQYTDFRDNVQNLNLAEIPVSTEFFFEWMNKHVFEEEKRSYPLMNFVRDICNKLVVELLDEVCLNRDSEKKMIFKTSQILATPSPSALHNDPIKSFPWINYTPFRNVTKAHDLGLAPLNGNLTGFSINDCYNYILVHPVTTVFDHKGTGDREVDEKNGVRHLSMGLNRGLVKSIKFAKSDMMYIREARFFNHGYDGLMQLGAVYKVTVEMVGNTLLYPGMEVWIDPTTFGGTDFNPRQGPKNNSKASVANALGIGGYHIITRVTHNISQGVFKTSVDAMFHYSGDGNKASFTKTSGNSQSSSDSDRKIEKFNSGQDEDFCRNVIITRQKNLQDIHNESLDKPIWSSADAEDIQKQAKAEADAKATTGITPTTVPATVTPAVPVGTTLTNSEKELLGLKPREKKTGPLTEEEKQQILFGKTL